MTTKITRTTTSSLKLELHICLNEPLDRQLKKVTQNREILLASGGSIVAIVLITVGFLLAQSNKPVESDQTSTSSSAPSKVTANELLDPDPAPEENRPPTTPGTDTTETPAGPDTTGTDTTETPAGPDTTGTDTTETPAGPDTTGTGNLNEPDPPPPGIKSTRSLSCGEAEGYVHYTKSGDSIHIYRWEVKVSGTESVSTVLRAYGPSGYEKFLDSTTAPGNAWLDRQASANVTRNTEEPSFPGIAIDVNHDGTGCTMFTNPWL